MVSIHAPTRGATVKTVTVLGEVKFQSTHPHGVRPQLDVLALSGFCFNPRTHTGCDKIIAYPDHDGYSFNPRTHTGCDY